MICHEIICLHFVKGARSKHVTITSADNPTPPPAVHRPRLALSSLDSSVRGYMEQGLAASTQRVYRSAMKRLADFCTCYNVCDPFPLSGKLLCYYAVFLAECNLTPRTITTYLATARSMHITLVFLNPCDSSSLTRLQRIQAGIKRVLANKRSAPVRVGLPITPAILDQIRTQWEEDKHLDRFELWAGTTLCFAGFFHSGELFPLSVDQSTHGPPGIAWGNVAVDDAQAPTMP